MSIWPKRTRSSSWRAFSNLRCRPVGMAEALQHTGAEVLYGDLMFILGLPFPIYSMKALDRVVRVAAPLVVQLPFKMLYPIGEKQEEQPNKEKFAKYYQWADVIAGDFHLIRKYMPERLDGKKIITNTVTKDDVSFLREQGVAKLVTTTYSTGAPLARSMEALLVARWINHFSYHTSRLSRHARQGRFHALNLRV